MTPLNYLQRLTVELSDGLSRLPATERDCHFRYLHSAQNADGGFSGREGGSDLYYTAFALRSLAVLDALTPEIAGRASAFLRQRCAGQASVIDFYSLLYACVLVQTAGADDPLAESPPDWPERVAETLESYRTTDGGYAKAPGGAAGSTYHTFLVGLCYELLGREVPRLDDAVRFVLTRRREDGGFVEIAPMRRSGTNPTAAAVGLMRLLGRELEAGIRTGVVNFLAQMPTSEGGIRANTRIPLADLLSTFTAAWTLFDLDALDRLDRAAALRYARSLQSPGGGFRGGLWDDGCDVEYTFYGLGVLGLLS